MLTRKEMEAAINQGGSVLVNGEVYDSVDALPPEHILAAGDAKRAQSSLDALDHQIAVLQAQRSALARTAEDAAAKEQEAKDRPQSTAEEKEADKNPAKKTVQLGPKVLNK